MSEVTRIQNYSVKASTAGESFPIPDFPGRCILVLQAAAPCVIGNSEKDLQAVWNASGIFASPQIVTFYLDELINVRVLAFADMLVTVIKRSPK